MPWSSPAERAVIAVVRDDAGWCTVEDVWQRANRGAGERERLAVGRRRVRHHLSRLAAAGLVEERSVSELGDAYVPAGLVAVGAPAFRWKGLES